METRWSTVPSAMTDASGTGALRSCRVLRRHRAETLHEFVTVSDAVARVHFICTHVSPNKSSAMPTLTRRALLAGSALAAVAAPAGPSVAAAPPAGKEAPGIYRY